MLRNRHERSGSAMEQKDKQLIYGGEQSSGRMRRSFVQGLLSLVALAVFSPLLHAQYTYERAITIDLTKVPNTDQSSFPVLVSGTYSYLATVANGGKVRNAN